MGLIALVFDLRVYFFMTDGVTCASLKLIASCVDNRDFSDLDTRCDRELCGLEDLSGH